MKDPTIDSTQARAICEEVGERLRTQLKPSPPDEKTDLDDKLDRLLAREVDE